MGTGDGKRNQYFITGMRSPRNRLSWKVRLDEPATFDVSVRYAAGDPQAGVWTVGGGPANAMSLAEMSHWCAERFGAHDVAAGGTSRRWDVPWVVMDSRRAAGTFGWQPSTRIEDILDGIARHYVDHPDWLDVSRPLH
jgi:CDP-paratose 2-epimerase